ncbi:radical SAM family heme chaperone HemW [Thiorhodospira sibirica]|uniref:radical SAM family heme chaperone HemW n=1 Tax=Thiorhodospira sibirica TaxID=154347 RepID=UPI00022C5284|nr:radical SAM family heme chaperone HemW [Thiorhodospira sibirica]
MSDALPPLGLYVHLPFCLRKCPYCDFNSYPTPPTSAQQGRYIQALLADLDADLQAYPHIRTRPLHSLFIGGGTPSLFAPAALGQLLDGVGARLHCPLGLEISLEANPGTLNLKALRAYHALGINRLSLGIQSFHAPHLRALGRLHDAHAARQAICDAHIAGFSRINLDLMFGLPQQNPQQALADLNTALSYAPSHLSWYQLTLEEDTPFAHHPPAHLPDEESLWAIQHAGLARLAEAGYQHYEISAHAPPGMECQHNLNYWQFGDYLGIGAGAHGKISSRSAAGTLVIERRSKQREPQGYIEQALNGASLLASAYQLSASDTVFECMLNALRLQEGIPLSLFTQHTGLTASCLQSPWQHAITQGLMQNHPKQLAPTALGQRFLNDLQTLFLPT